MPFKNPKPKLWQDHLRTYAFIFGLMGAALALTSLIYDLVSPMISPLFLFAVIVVAWRHGFRYAVFATFLAGVIIDFFFIEPQKKLSMGANDILRLTIFFLEGVGFSWLINSRKLAAEAVKESREQLLALSLRENIAREEERKRLSLEVHDELGQSLTSIKMQLHLLRKNLANDKAADREKSLETIDPLLGLVDGTIASVRRIATELRPPVLDDLGLVPALEWQTHEFKRTTGIECSFSANVENPPVGSDVSTAFFRIFQEALTNVARHSKATKVDIRLMERPSSLELSISDNGVGLRKAGAPTPATSLGILGMRERARNIGGSLEVTGGDKGGTSVQLRAPLLIGQGGAP